MPQKKVHIIETDGEYRVHPPIVELDFAAGDQLIVKNNSNDDLVVYVGSGAFDLNDPVAKPVKAGKKAQFNAVTQGAGNSNAYVYQVIAPKSGKKAKGNSDPVIIIEN